ncbi:quinone oxidoreductase family protein [Leucobacter sp. M11]|uniref:quinone oxidoreductase family protein n=1 Tax=Leucobacter sp. M11 TaxID=2993565 RepID=UPI002D7E98F3|nr:zinc-binding dehydrogenase [Leucobacter sp. M11]
MVRVSHASVGVTDAIAMRGDYLMQPFPGFVPGYDFIGVVEHLPRADATGLLVGQRVAGILPRMGAHATMISAAPALLVPVPEDLDSATAATIPLDAVTASFALDALALERADSILVQGAGGAVSSWAVQLAARRGHTVHGTTSSRSRAHSESLGAHVLDYRDPAWTERLIAATGGGVAGAIDQTGSRAVRRVVVPGGRIVRIAFGGSPGHQRMTTARGFLAANLRRYARPAERVCSIPMSVPVRRAAYRQALDDALRSVAAGTLAPPEPRLFPLAAYSDAMTAAENADPGAKVILTAG